MINSNLPNIQRQTPPPPRRSQCGVAQPLPDCHSLILSLLVAVLVGWALQSQADSTSAALPETGIPVSLVAAIVQVESHGQIRCIGASGERGLMQIRQSTWYEVSERVYGRPVSFDAAFLPVVNRTIGTAYLLSLRQQLQSYRSQWQSDERTLLLAAYNCGLQRVRQANFCFDYLPRSTRSYVKRATALAEHYRGNSDELRIALAPNLSATQ